MQKFLFLTGCLDSLGKSLSSLNPPNPRMRHESGIQGQSSEGTVMPSKLFAKCEQIRQHILLEREPIALVIFPKRSIVPRRLRNAALGS